jgi:hypothetical protein
MTRVSSRSPRLLLTTGALLLAGGLAACAEPELADPVPDEPAIEAPATPETPEPSSQELLAATEDLTSVLTEARDHLSAAATADGIDEARDAANGALGLLVADPDAETDTTTVFPGATSEARGGSGEASDALTLTLSAAQEAGGAVGRRVVDALRDPLAGDLGLWQRDPAGLLAQLRQDVADAGDLAATEQAVLSIPGDGTRALAWTLLAVDADDLDDLQAYAERGATHLEFAVDAVRDALGVVADEVRDEAGDAGDGA